MLRANTDSDEDQRFLSPFFLQVVSSCTPVHPAAPVQVPAAHPVDTRPSRRPPTRSPRPRRAPPFRRSGSWSREGNVEEEPPPQKWSFSFLRWAVLQSPKLRRFHRRPTVIPPQPKGHVVSPAPSPVSTHAPPSLSSSLKLLWYWSQCLTMLLQRPEVWCFYVRCAATSHLVSIMACTPARAARWDEGNIISSCVCSFPSENTGARRLKRHFKAFIVPLCLRSVCRGSSDAAFSRISTTRCAWRTKTVSSCAWTATGASIAALRSASPWACPEMVRDTNRI